MQAMYPTGVMILVDTQRRQAASDLIESRLTTLRYPSVAVGPICTAKDNGVEFQRSCALWSQRRQERGSVVEEGVILEVKLGVKLARDYTVPSSEP